MVRFYDYGGIYDPAGFERRNRTVEIPPVNPLPSNAKRADTGDAGQDGYTVYSRADRRNGYRPDIGPCTEDYHGPKLEDE
jgi:hypothetical protein